MKTVKALTLSLLFGLSSVAVANTQAATQPVEQNAVAQTAQTQQIANLNTVNINTASAAELQDKLVGIGGKKAQAIVDYRTKHGNFQSIEQLAEVSGIGQATIEKNRVNIVLE